MSLDVSFYMHGDFVFRWVNTREWIDAKEHLVMIKFYLKYNEKQKKQMIQRCYVPML